MTGWRWPRLALVSGPPPGHFSEEERQRLVAGGGGSRRRRRPSDGREIRNQERLPLWVTIFLVVTVTMVWSATYVAAIVNPKFSPDGFVGPAILAIIPLVSTYHIVVNRKGRDD